MRTVISTGEARARTAPRGCGRVFKELGSLRVAKVMRGDFGGEPMSKPAGESDSQIGHWAEPDDGRPSVKDEAHSDAELVQRVLSGSPRALAALYRRHGPMVHRVAYRFLASEQDAQDLLQDVFVGLPDALRVYEERDRFEHWLKRLAVRTSLMVLRTRKRRREDPIVEPSHFASPAETDHPGRVTDHLAVRRAIARLSDEQRVVLMLKQVDGYSHAEIGDLLGISEGASAARLYRALRRLWELLGDTEAEE